MSVQLSDVSVVHANGQRALTGVSLTVAPGERVAVIGPSGAGKTTLLRLLGAALRPTDGRVALLGQSPWELPPAELQRLRVRIATIHQAPPLPPRQRVVTAVLAGRLGVWPLWKSLLSLLYPVDIAGAREALARLDLADRLFDRCDQLSGGQLQRVGIARAFYQRPELLLADEPVSAMDPALAEHTIGHLHDEAHSRGATLIASLHAVDLALKHFPRVVGVRGGQVAFDLPPAAIDEARLRDLYASERGILPTFAGDTLATALAPALAATETLDGATGPAARPKLTRCI